jgi:hypothetical protein
MIILDKVIGLDGQLFLQRLPSNLHNLKLFDPLEDQFSLKVLNQAKHFKLKFQEEFRLHFIILNSPHLLMLGQQEEIRSVYGGVHKVNGLHFVFLHQPSKLWMIHPKS